VTQFDEVFMAGGRPLLVHRAEYCQGRNCSIHNPSDHPLRVAPHVWRSDRGLMERECEHGIGHPDPDDLAFKKRIGNPDVPSLAVHGCDGCCWPERKPVQMEFVKRVFPREPILLPLARLLNSFPLIALRKALLAMAVMALICILLGYQNAGYFITLLVCGAFWSASFFLVRHYKHHSQFYRRSNR
jgi:hypothetical protein